MSHFYLFSEVEVAVLPLIRDLYRIIEHDRPDGNQRRKDSVEAGQKVADLVRLYMMNYVKLLELQIFTSTFSGQETWKTSRRRLPPFGNIYKVIDLQRKNIFLKACEF